MLEGTTEISICVQQTHLMVQGMEVRNFQSKTEQKLLCLHCQWRIWKTSKVSQLIIAWNTKGTRQIKLHFIYEYNEAFIDIRGGKKAGEIV